MDVDSVWTCIQYGYAGIFKALKFNVVLILQVRIYNSGIVCIHYNNIMVAKSFETV